MIAIEHNLKQQSTIKAFDFLLGHVHQKNTKWQKNYKNKAVDNQILVIYNLDENVERILKDLDEQSLDDILKYDGIRWGQYKLRWRSDRFFVIEEVIKSKEKIRPRKRRRVELLSANNLFERETFEKACETWKASSLQELVNRYTSACERVGIKPKHWWGKGQLGGAWLSANVDKEHYAPDSELSKYRDLIKDAYYGGRMQHFTKGFVGDATSYDINSAYAAAIIQLPSLKGAKLRKVKKYDARYKHGLWRVRWEENDHEVGPFPMGHPGPDNKELLIPEKVIYPLSGEGTYHAVEVRAALRSGYNVKVRWGWVLDIKSREKPFIGLSELYIERERLKRKDPNAARILKYTPQGVYGRFCYKPKPILFAKKSVWSSEDKIVTRISFDNSWESFFWAGEITAWTRAYMLQLAQLEKPINIVTDSIYFRKPQKVKEYGKGLGGLKKKSYEKLWITKSTLWKAVSNGVEVRKTGGHHSDDIDFVTIENNPRWHGYKKRTYVNLFRALRGDMSQWMKKTTEFVVVSLDDPDIHT